MEELLIIMAIPTVLFAVLNIYMNIFVDYQEDNNQILIHYTWKGSRLIKIIKL